MLIRKYEKRIWTLLLGFILTLSLSSCGVNENEASDSVTQTDESQVILEEPSPIKSDTSQSLEGTLETIEHMGEENTTAILEGTPTSDVASTEENSATTSVTDTPAYTFVDLDVVKYTTSKVNVRALPTTDGEKLGSLNQNTEVKVTGQCNETSWFRVDYNGQVAYVSNDYLSDEKKIVETQPNTSNSNKNKANTTEPCPYPLHQLMYDSRGCAYFYDYYGGKATMAPEDYAKSEAAFSVYNEYMFSYIREHNMTEFLTSWKLIGTYAEGTIVVRWTCFGNNYDTKPEDFGIPTAGNGILK